MASMIGNLPNQVPTNGDLGTMAFQDASNINVGSINSTSLTVLGNSSATSWSGGGIVTTGVANTFTAQQTFKGLVDTVFTITDAAAFEINPSNGSMQVITLGANRTPAATTFLAGQCVLLGINDGTAFTVTWTTVAVTWVKAGGTASAPTLATTGYTWVLLWKVGSVVYGTTVGSP